MWIDYAHSTPQANDDADQINRRATEGYTDYQDGEETKMSRDKIRVGSQFSSVHAGKTSEPK